MRFHLAQVEDQLAELDRGVRPGEFFRLRLLIATPEAIEEHLADLRRDCKELRKQITSIMWHMRGGLSREEAWTLSYRERKDVMALIEERIKIVEKTRLPLL